MVSIMVLLLPFNSIPKDNAGRLLLSLLAIVLLFPTLFHPVLLLLNVYLRPPLGEVVWEFGVLCHLSAEDPQLCLLFPLAAGMQWTELVPANCEGLSVGC